MRTLVSTRSVYALPADSVTPDAFVDGRPVVFTDVDKSVSQSGVLTVHYRDDVWYALDVLRAGGSKGNAVLDFSTLPPWLKDYAKRFIAYHWRGRRETAGALVKRMVVFRELADVLGRGSYPFVGPITELSREHGRAVARVYNDKGERGARLLPDAKGMSGREKYAAFRAADALHPLVCVQYIGSLRAFATWLRTYAEVDTDFDHYCRASRVVRDAARATWNGVYAGDEKALAEGTVAAVIEACRADIRHWRAMLAGAPVALDGARRDRPPIGDEERGLRLRHGKSRAHAGRRATYASATMLLMVTGRRRGALTETRASVRTREGAVVNDLPTVEVELPMNKMYGERGHLDWVPCPGYLGEVALEAIAIARELRDWWGTRTQRPLPEHLFVSARRRVVGRNAAAAPRTHTTAALGWLVQPIDADELQRYLVDLPRRYAIPNAEHLRTHAPRATLATAIVEAGGGLTLAARFLGHTVTSAKVARMAQGFYVAAGTPGMLQRMAMELGKGNVTGRIINAVGRVVTRALGPEAEALPIPANQLSYEEAVGRLRRANLYVDDDRSAEQILALLEQGLVLNFTSYGGCILPATSGPCPTAEKCPIGTEPEAPETLNGEGCPWQALMEHGVEQLEEDVRLCELKLEWYGTKPEYAFWRTHETRRLTIHQRQLARARTLRAASTERAR